MTQTMRRKLKRAGYRSRRRLRKQIVEPVFGQIKQARGFRQFLLRGLEAVQAEWALICTAHNSRSPDRASPARGRVDVLLDTGLEQIVLLLSRRSLGRLAIYLSAKPTERLASRPNAPINLQEIKPTDAPFLQMQRLANLRQPLKNQAHSDTSSDDLPIAPRLRHSVPHRLQVLAYRLRKTLHRIDPRRARIDQPSVQPLRRSTAKQASKPHRQAPHRCELGGRRFQRIDVGDLPGRSSDRGV